MADTAAIQKAIDDCHAAGGGTVLVPAGVFEAGTVHLRSNITLHLDSGAVLRSIDAYSDFILIEAPYWQVRPFLFGRNVEDVAITGQGMIDGARIFNRERFEKHIKVKHPDQLPGWVGGELNRGPHTVVFYDSKRIRLRDFRVVDSANYAVRIRNSEDIDIQGLTITAGWDGLNIHHSKQVTISNCRIQTGDDAIAGSGNENLIITNCVLNSSCNGVRLMYGNKHVIISNVVIYGPGVYEHRTSKRHNTESGITIRPFRRPDIEKPESDDFTEDILISNIIMDRVHRPLVIGIYKGNSGMRGLSIRNVTVTHGGKGSSIIHGEAGARIEDVTLSGIQVHADGGVKRSDGITPAYGFELRHIDEVTARDVVLRLNDGDERPALLASHVGRLEIDGYRAERSAGAEMPVAFQHVGEIFVNSSPSLPLREAVVKSVEATPSLRNGRFVAGFPFSLEVAASGSGASGLHRFPLKLGERDSTGWIWLDGDEERETTVGGLVLDQPGKKEITAGNASTTIKVESRPEQAAIVMQELDITPVPVKELEVVVSALNYVSVAGRGSVAARWNGDDETATVDIPPGETKTIRLAVDVPGPGRHTLHVDGFPPREVLVPGPVGDGFATAGYPDCCYQFKAEERFYIRSPRKRYDIADEYQAIFRPDALPAQGTVTVKVGAPDGRGGWATRSGIVVREDISGEFSKSYIVLAASGGNGWSLQWDTDGDGIFDQHTEFDGYTVWPHWLRLERNGDRFTGYHSEDGADWLKVGEATVADARGALDAGFFAMGANAMFSEFRVVGKE